MAEINVLFHVPEWIAQGLKNGTLERVGGVIRDASGSKTVRAWLREGGKVSLENPSGQLSGQWAQLGMQSSAMIGLQLVNIAVSVAGFVILYRKLQQIEKQLTHISAQLEQLSSGVTWLDHKFFLAQAARIVSAVKSLERVHLYKDPALARQVMQDASKELLDGGTYFKQVLMDLFQRQLEYQRADETLASYRAWVLASNARIQVLTAMGEPDLAASEALQLRCDHAEWGGELTKAMRDPLRSIGKSDINVSLMQQLKLEALSAHELIRGRALQLEYLVDEDIEIASLEHPGLQDHDGLAVYVA